MNSSAVIFPQFSKNEDHVWLESAAVSCDGTDLPDGSLVKPYVALGTVASGGGSALVFWSFCISLVMGLLVWRVKVGGW